MKKIQLQRCIIRTLSNIYDVIFLRKQFTDLTLNSFHQKVPQYMFQTVLNTLVVLNELLR